jgi:Uri superfamily endonuclease
LRGTYTLVIRCHRSVGVVFGRLGYAKLRKGYLLYTGSALGHGSFALEERIRRHASRSKRVRWHVDYLTSRTHFNVKAVVCLNSRRRLECAINRSISHEMAVELVIRGLGSSDCNCDAHLLSVASPKNAYEIQRVLKGIYSRFGRSFTFTFPSARSVGLLPTSSRTRLERS